jgi:tRNA pseudouridine55 synthase
MFGLLNLNKPSDITSRRVVDLVQRLVRPAKVGHAGTLDPLARGVLVLGIGQATRLVEYVQEMPKHYRTTFLLGRTSTTEDVEGDVTKLPAAVPPSREKLEQAARQLRGEIEQRPPAFSALKVDGRRAYDLARSGREVELAPRRVRIDRLDIVRYEYPELCLDIVCGGGTYVRSLGRDLAEHAGTAAVMAALERSSIGHFTIADAVDPESLTADNLARHLLPAVLAVRGLMPERIVSSAECERLRHGLPIQFSVAAPKEQAERCAAIDSEDRLVAIVVRAPGGPWRPIKTFPTE